MSLPATAETRITTQDAADPASAAALKVGRPVRQQLVGLATQLAESKNCEASSIDLDRIEQVARLHSLCTQYWIPSCEDFASQILNGHEFTKVMKEACRETPFLKRGYCYQDMDEQIRQQNVEKKVTPDAVEPQKLVEAARALARTGAVRLEQAQHFAVRSHLYATAAAGGISTARLLDPEFSNEDLLLGVRAQRCALEIQRAEYLRNTTLRELLSSRIWKRTPLPTAAPPALTGRR